MKSTQSSYNYHPVFIFSSFISDIRRFLFILSLCKHAPNYVYVYICLLRLHNLSFFVNHKIAGCGAAFRALVTAISKLGNCPWNRWRLRPAVRLVWRQKLLPKRDFPTWKNSLSFLSVYFNFFNDSLTSEKSTAVPISFLTELIIAVLWSFFG